MKNLWYWFLKSTALLPFADHAFQIFIHNLDSDLSWEYSLRCFQLGKVTNPAQCWVWVNLSSPPNWSSLKIPQDWCHENQRRFHPTKKRFLIREISTRSIGCVSVSLIPPPIHSLSIQYWQPLRIPWVYGIESAGERFLVFKKSAWELVKEGGTTWDLQNTSISVDANQQTEYYLRLEPNLILQAEISLWEPEALRGHFTDRYNLLSVSWGAIGCNTFFSLLFFFFLRDRTYFFHHLHLLFFTFHDWFNWVRIHVVGLSIITVLLFFSKVLNLKEKYPISHKIIRSAVFCILGISFLVAWFEPNQAFQIFMILSAISTLFLLIPYKAWRTGDRNALFYSLGWGSYAYLRWGEASEMR